MLIKQTHKKCIVKVGEAAISQILGVTLELHEPTRRDIAALSGYSEVTVGKITQAIYALGLADKTEKKPLGGGRVCAHLSHSDNLRFIIIDLSSREFSMSLVTSSLKCLCQYSYIYSDSLRFEENLMIFLDRGTRRLAEENLSFSACAVIVENQNRVCRAQISGIMPARANDVPLIKEKISAVLGHSPDLVISPDACIKQFLLDSHGTESAYIMMGRTLCTCYLSKARNLTVCKPWNMIIDGKPLSEYISGTSQLPVIYTAAAKLVNTIDCSFSPKQTIIQSDSLALGRDFPTEIESYLSSLYAAESHIKVCDYPYPAQIYGCASILRNKFFKKHIVSFESIKE